MELLPEESGETDDLVLAQAVLQGDEKAFRVLMKRHLQPLRSFIALRAPVTDLIDEVAHDTFVFAYSRMGDFEKGSMQPWLRTVAVNLLRDRIKAFAREHKNMAQYTEQVRWETAIRRMDRPVDDTSDHLVRCLQQLPKNLREVLDMRYQEQITSEEIAARTGRSAMAIRTLLVRVRQQLKTCMEARSERVGI